MQPCLAVKDFHHKSTVPFHTPLECPCSKPTTHNTDTVICPTKVKIISLVFIFQDLGLCTVYRECESSDLVFFFSLYEFCVERCANLAGCHTHTNHPTSNFHSFLCPSTHACAVWTTNSSTCKRHTHDHEHTHRRTQAHKQHQQNNDRCKTSPGPSYLSSTNGRHSC